MRTDPFSTEPIRTCHFRPYMKGQGPTFALRLYDAGRPHRPGAPQWGVAYVLTMRESGGGSVELFRGDDFGCSPLHGIDSDECVAGVMGFLTLRPGDTDDEYFEGYSEAQREFASQHAEALGSEVLHRFGEA
jgi:hypothetical protein